MNLLIVFELILVAGFLIVHTEFLVMNKQYSNKGLLSWELLSLSYFWSSSKRIFQSSKFNIVKLVSAIGIACSILILTSTNGWLLGFLFLVQAFLFIILFFRSRYGMDGSDQLFMWISITLAFYHFNFNAPEIQKLLLIFITIQVTISYVTAGVAKIVSAEWRSGKALAESMSTRIYGNKFLFNFLKTKSKISLVLAWGVILFEIGFVTIYFVPDEVKIVYLITGFLFHLSNAIFMRLNSFFLVFVSTYPLFLVI